jgi:beta-aspartyl-peptidase (threonine type)
MGFALAIHGGCGTAAASQASLQEWATVRQALAEALRAGEAVLRQGGAALDAVEAAVRVLEDSPHFNAGHGAALTEAATHELDASIMDGATLAAGAVCTVRHVRNPIRAARAVMERSGCVLMSGEAADAFAAGCGLPTVDNDWFSTPRRRQALAAMKARRAAGTLTGASENERHGTVGAVALDIRGHLAAATSTGGFNDKPVGRVGDSPIIGAGTYAMDGLCAVSCTGQGEAFVRHVAAYDVVARMRYAGASLEAAARTVILETIGTAGLGAGLVAVDAAGRISAPYSTAGMARGWVRDDGVLHVATHETVHAIGPG